MASMFSVGSAAAQHFPQIRDRLAGFDGFAYTPVRWLYTGMPTDTVRNWVTVPGRGDAGRTPRGYRQVAVLACDAAQITLMHEDDRQAHDAVAYALGKAVMIGVLPEHRLFYPTELGEKLVGMRLGRGDLVASMGVWSPGSGVYTPTESPVRLANTMLAQNAAVEIPIVEVFSGL